MRTFFHGRSGAFTLAEMLVVVVILAVAAAVVVPMAVNTEDLQATAAARLLCADLQYAQSEAITRQEAVTVTFSVNGNSYALSNASGVLIHPINKAAFNVDFDTADGFGKTEVASVNFNGAATVTFDELGAPDTPGYVMIQAGGTVYRVSLAAATGRVTVALIGS